MKAVPTSTSGSFIAIITVIVELLFAVDIIVFFLKKQHSRCIVELFLPTTCSNMLFHNSSLNKNKITPSRSKKQKQKQP